MLEITGLRHLAGRAVSCLANGNVVKGLTVSATGGVTLTNRASRVHVGLKYISDIETLNVEAASSGPGTIQDDRKLMTAVTLRFKDTRGILVGPNKDKLIEMKQREFEAMGEPTALITGDKKIIIKSEWNTNGRLFMRQRDPLPVTLLAVIPDYTVGDEGDA